MFLSSLHSLVLLFVLYCYFFFFWIGILSTIPFVIVDIWLHFCLCLWIEPYSYFKKIGRKETEVCDAASKRLYVENKPYLVGGCTPHMLTANEISSCALAGSKYSVDLQKLKCSQFNPPRNFHSMAEKYEYMGETFKKRLAFGKENLFWKYHYVFSCVAH